MAGFVENNKPSSPGAIDRIRQSVKSLSTFGMKYDDMVVRNSQAIGATEAGFMNKDGHAGKEDESLSWALAKQDINSKQYITYFDKDYKGKRDYLRKFGLNPEIEWVLDTICDESISYDPANYFAYPAFLDLTDVNEKFKNDLYDSYKKLYDIWGFSDDITAWQYFRQFLVDGFLSFEIIFDNEGKNIIGFKELDPVTLVPSVEKQTDGSFLSTWTQYPQDPKKRRILYEPQIIYISYAKGNSITRISYVERLIRPFNILRTIEYTRVIWSVMNSQFRMKMTIPIGTKSVQKGMQTLGELMSIYKEDFDLNDTTGELLIDGKPKIQFYKNYLMPSGQGGTPTIEPINSEGPNLNDSTPLNYFFDRFIQETKIPSSRFSTPEGGSSSAYSNAAEGFDKDEIRFFKFIERLRSVFQDIMIKPLWVQMARKHKELEKDFIFKSQLGLNFFSDNPFKLNQEIEVINKRKETVTSMIGLLGDEDKPYFSVPFLVENFLGVDKKDLKTNSEIKARKKKEKEKEAKKGEGKAPAGETPPAGKAPAAGETPPEGESPEVKI